MTHLVNCALCGKPCVNPVAKGRVVKVYHMPCLMAHTQDCRDRLQGKLDALKRKQRKVD